VLPTFFSQYFFESLPISFLNIFSYCYQHFSSTFFRSVAKHFFVSIFRNVAYIFSRQHFSGPTFFNHHFKEMLVSSTIFCQHFTKCCNIFSSTFLVIFVNILQNVVTFLGPTFFQSSLLRDVTTFLGNVDVSTIFSTFAKCYNIFY
jgi:hypothetical protein